MADPLHCSPSFLMLDVGAIAIALCKKGCYTVLYNACIHVLCTRYTRVIRMCITLRMDTLYTVAYNNYSITLCITSV